MPGVEIVPRTEAVGLDTTAGGRRVTGVRVRGRGCQADVLSADLVVDASGRASRTPRWLDGLGLPAPREHRVPIGLGYATRTYRARPELVGGDLGIIPAPYPPIGRGGGLAALEGDRWIVTLAGVLGDHPPSDPAGFEAFARSLPVPDIHDAITGTEPLDDPVPFRFPASVRRRYERLGNFPDRLLIIGDGFCSFNPVYGQGMTVAALEALTLRRHLGERPPNPRALHRDLAQVVDAPWDMVVGADLAFPGVEGRRPRRLRLVNGYLGRLQAAAADDARVATAFVRVAGLIDAPSALLHPRIAARVLRHARHRTVGHRPPARNFPDMPVRARGARREAPPPVAASPSPTHRPERGPGR